MVHSEFYLRQPTVKRKGKALVNWEKGFGLAFLVFALESNWLGRMRVPDWWVKLEREEPTQSCHCPSTVWFLLLPGRGVSLQSSTVSSPSQECQRYLHIFHNSWQGRGQNKAGSNSEMLPQEQIWMGCQWKAMLEKKREKVHCVEAFRWKKVKRLYAWMQSNF